MESVKQLLADALQYLTDASPREKRLIAAAAGGLVVFVALIGWSMFSRSIAKAEQALEERRDDFAKVEKLAVNYGAMEMERQSLEQRLRQSPGQLQGYVEGVAKQAQIDIGSMSERPGAANSAGKPREAQVEVKLGKVPLDKLMNLLRSIEQNPGVVRVRRLRLYKSTDSKDTLEVQLTVSAWQAS